MSAPAQTWHDVCVDFATSAGVEPDMLEVLSAFRSPAPRGGPPPPPEGRFGGSFAELERALERLPEFDDVPASLAEIDDAQAQMFARRLHAVDDALVRADDTTGRLLRVGLRMRMLGILRAPGPRALRLRALADFYYSHLGRHLHRRAGALGPSLAELVSALTWRELGSGLEHALLDGPSEAGPIFINLLRVDPQRVRVEACDCREALARGLEFAAYTHELGAIAAVSGGFFLYSEPDIEAPSRRYDPIGLLLSEGELLNPPIFRRGAVLVGESGELEIARLGLDATSIHVRGRALPGDGAITRAHARHGPPGPSVAIVGRRVVACGERLAVPLNGFVLPLHGPCTVEVGDAVDYGPVRSPNTDARLRSGIAGGPLLVEAGRPVIDMREEDFWGSAPPLTFSQDETGDHNLLPRLAAGLDAQGRLVLAAIDGRNFERALGMTLSEVGALMISLGCKIATNLDGGSSKRMVVGGRTLDLASTEIRSDTPASTRTRPVHTALLLFDAGRP